MSAPTRAVPRVRRVERRYVVPARAAARVRELARVLGRSVDDVVTVLAASVGPELLADRVRRTLVRPGRYRVVSVAVDADTCSQLQQLAEQASTTIAGWLADRLTEQGPELIADVYRIGLLRALLLAHAAESTQEVGAA
ncbi:hypothetical protein [Amycolatopsis dongchuanensis]|uniref:Uncharacterized protein n=1 Tax=Amycolatopsis dongchuanensis TaxID=1070866 RepID=A0ABP9QL96_9PSEU